MRSKNALFNLKSLRRSISIQLAKRRLPLILGEREICRAQDYSPHFLGPQSYLSTRIRELTTCFDRRVASKWVSSESYFDFYPETLPGDSYADSRMFYFGGSSIWLEEIGMAFPFVFPFAWKVKVDLSCARLVKLFLELRDFQNKGEVPVSDGFFVFACQEEMVLFFLAEEVFTSASQVSRSRGRSKSLQ